MKVFISVNMKGISGIMDITMTSRTQGDYEKGRALMVGDVNAAIEASMVGHYGIPLILVAGDLAVTKEVKGLAP